MAADKLTVHITADDMRPLLAQAVQEALKEIVQQIAVLRERVDHMQDRLDQQGARLRHLAAFTDQHQTVLEQHGARLNDLEALPGVRDALAGR